ncbi:hypothetical protein QYE76_003946 [Lolium multiflorum]|uniref:C2H2-type domain-containing protein n=1 Tax=Lolium multiflorum TaxID=4521 RepID=A0AAD8RPQ0_LOLMU|nr:hypothetical protein QYE76_003946 [Lolium multiflorum]
MESTGSCTRSTASTSQALAIRGEGNKLAQKNPELSRAPSYSSASKKKAPDMLPFKCKYCPRMFATTRGRTVHETKVHKDLRRVRQNKKQKEHRHLAPAGPLLFKSTRSAANAYLSTEGGGQVRSLREVNNGETAHGINNFPSLRSGTMHYRNGDVRRGPWHTPTAKCRGRRRMARHGQPASLTLGVSLPSA